MRTTPEIMQMCVDGQKAYGTVYSVDVIQKKAYNNVFSNVVIRVAVTVKVTVKVTV
jgi:hypothetical protein